MDKTVAVIGGSGFIGRAIIERLTREGVRVIALCRNAEKAKFLKTMGVVGQVTVVAGNALSDEDLERVIAPADSVVNLIGILAEGGAQRFDALQGELPGRIGQLATSHKLASVVHVSAIGADCDSASKYARSKGAGEAALHAAFPRAVILRPSIVFGPRDSFFNRFAGLAMLAPGLPLPGGGKMRMQPVYVGDVVEAVMVALGHRDAPNARGKTIEGGVFELGGPDVYSFADLMRVTLRAINRRRLLIPVPLPLMSLGALFTGMLPNPPLTVDQVRLLAMDNVVGHKARGLDDLGITPTPVSAILPEYMGCYRPGGQFSRR
ncbi:MAG: complex I NDUFA9 subunit family protein [Candidatus Puniceispirillaceae bacterium]